MEKKILYLTLNKKWFDAIASGEKTEEYRVLTNYWKRRLLDEKGRFKKFDIIRFTNGYAPKVNPTMDVKCKGFGGFEKTGNMTLIKIKLGKIISIKNWKNES